MKFSEKLNFLIFAVFPKKCVYCGSLIAGDRVLCDECQDNLPRIEGEICPFCGRGKNVCGCGKKHNYFKRIVAPFYYEGRVKQGILRFKFRSNKKSAPEFAKEMAKCVELRYPGVSFDMIVGVPMSPKKQNDRGYNQSHLLCSELSVILGIPFDEKSLVKLYETRQQHNLSVYLRKGNLVGVFDCSNPAGIRNKTILLVDDISTGGETLNECAKMLWLYDAKEIYCVTLALTKRKKKGEEQ